MMNVPKLRFKEFSGEWVKSKIGDFVSSHKGGASLTPSDFVNYSSCEVIPKKAIIDGGVLSVDQVEPTYCNESFFNKNLQSVIDSSYLVTTLRDLVPTGPSIGYIVKYTGEKKYILAQGVYGLKLTSNIFDEFLTCFSNTQKYRKTMQKIMVGSTQVHVRNGDFFNVTIFTPTLPEQTKIANFLTTIDERINQLTRKKELMTQYKQGVMQQIFSQKLRFKDDNGEDFGDWEEKELGDIFTITRGQVLSMGNVSSEPSTENPYPVYSSQTKNNGLSGYYSTYLYEDCITWTTDGANAGDVNYRTGKFFCTNVCGVLKSSKGHANACIAAMINQVSRSFVSYVGNPKLMNNVMAKITIAFPSVEEQTKIANFLTTLDEQIQHITQQIEATKQYKQGLLQQMFV